MNRIGGRYLANEGEGAPSDPLIHIFPDNPRISCEIDVVEFGVYEKVGYTCDKSEAFEYQGRLSFKTSRPFYFYGL